MPSLTRPQFQSSTIKIKRSSKHGSAKANPPARLVLALNFLKPFKASNVVEFSLEPQGDSTSLTWAMTGAVPFMFKIMHVLMNMDKMVGKDFEAGLANLKAVTEKS